MRVANALTTPKLLLATHAISTGLLFSKSALGKVSILCLVKGSNKLSWVEVLETEEKLLEDGTNNHQEISGKGIPMATQVKLAFAGLMTVKFVGSVRMKGKPE